MMLNQPSPEPREPRPGMKLCPKCQHEISDDARTCPNCGESFTTAGGVFLAIILALLIGGGMLFLR